MELVIEADGTGRCVYDEGIDLTGLGDVQISRASHVEPGESNEWWADLSPVGGPKLGPFPRRSLALEGERIWLERHWIARPNPSGKVERNP